jgi:polyhydroxybutyrate depolymerase
MRRFAQLCLYFALAAANFHSAYAAEYTSIQSGGFARQYILVVPKLASGPLPLIVVLHGTYGTGSKMQRGLGFDAYANQLGFAVAYPDAYQLQGERSTTRWNDGRETLQSTKLKINDVQFLRDMVADIKTKAAIDSKRIFVTGASNGGMMAYRAACEAADVFAASAPVIGNIPKPIYESCRPSQPVSILAINGTADPFVPFEGGQVCQSVAGRFCEKGYVASAAQSLALFAKAAGCQGSLTSASLPPKYPEDPKVRKVGYGGCSAGKQVGAYWIDGGGHTWPPKKGQLIGKNGEPTRNLDATKEIVQFFLAHK